MTISYPNNIDQLTNPTISDHLDSNVVPHATQHANANNAIEVIETVLGTMPQGAYSNVKTRLEAIEATLGIAPNGTFLSIEERIENIENNITNVENNITNIISNPVEPIREISWSFPGPVTPAGLEAGGLSPFWTPYQSPIEVVEVGWWLSARNVDATLTVTLVENGPGYIELDVPYEGTYYDFYRLPVGEIWDALEFWVIASSTLPADTVLGDGLTVTMWYRYV